ncbi:glycerate kinase [Mycobacterium sp. 852013-50091_SCH5140682]|uniref:glycerate kinase n=1 Tax=Mycobacterium sp. 852013-50091_SCH5140682 TaxID=1834109 RepID=UPI0007EA707A|nr:glycerate kinase [Mycobacterium sp. 852013-50091_SCH5140682]OBC09263.1 glycerate kinase [Mycobacterium sp. 852013-50091_SCH5140682]
MRIVIAPDKFKGSLGAEEAAQCLAAGIREARPDAATTVVPMADGGEGTLDAALANGYERREAVVHGPLGAPVQASFALRGDEAVVELAVASGLALVPADRRDALAASSRGTGELIAAALDAGATRIVLAIGGSASTDGGAGLIAALGARLLNASGTELADGGGVLRELAVVDLSGLDPRVARTRFVLACDVDHVLLGQAGAATVFGPQKGADAAQVAALEAGLTTFSRLIQRALQDERDLALMPGAGAAGGVGFAALAVLGAERRAGVDVVVDLVRLRDRLVGADLVVTGEGSFDEQSLGGKTPIGVARVSAELGIPVVAVCGRTTLGEKDWRAAGFVQCYATLDRAPDAETSMREAGRLLAEIGYEIADGTCRPSGVEPSKS